MSARTGRRLIVNTSSLAAASFFRIFVSFVLQLLVARQLNAAALGAFALMMAWLQIAQVTSEAGLTQWLVREGASHPERRGALLRHTLPIHVGTSLLAAGTLVALAWLLPGLLPPLPIVALAAMSLPFYVIMAAALAYFESAEAFARVFAVDVPTNALLLLSSAALLLAGAPLWTLFVALVVCQIFSVALALTLVWKSRPSTIHPADAPSLQWRTTLRSGAPFFTVALADVVQQRADLLLLGAIATPEVTGIYAAAVSIVRVAIKIVQAYWRALFPTLGRLLHPAAAETRAGATDRAGNGMPEHGERLFALALRLALIAAVGVAVVTTPLANGLAVLLFGAEFAPAGGVLTLLIWSAPLYAWETASITRLMAERAARAAVRITVVHLLLLLLVLPLLGWRYGAEGAAVASVIAAAGGAITGFWLLRQWNDLQSVGVLLRVAGCALVATAASTMVAQTIGWFGILPWGSALAATFVGLFAYAFLLIATRLFTGEDVSRLRRAIKA